MCSKYRGARGPREKKQYGITIPFLPPICKIFLRPLARRENLCYTIPAMQNKRGSATMIARTAPMGWNSWNTFGANISDALVREMADAMVEKGYRDAGYEYLVID